jgi:hypothetical protein
VALHAVGEANGVHDLQLPVWVTCNSSGTSMTLRSAPMTVTAANVFF